MLAVMATLMTLAMAAWIAWQPARLPSVVVDLPADTASPPANGAGVRATDVAARDAAGDGARAAAEQRTVAATSGEADADATESASAGAEATGADEPAVQGGEVAPAERQLAADQADRQEGLAAALAAERARGGPYEVPATATGADGGGEIADEPFIEIPLVVTRGSNLRVRPTVNSSRLMWVASGSGVLLLDPEPVRGYYKVSTGEREGWIWHINVEPADLAPSEEEQAGEVPATDIESAGKDASEASEPANAAERAEAPAAAAR